ncbi:Hsp20/alpha crystallin family protein [Natronomonas gomsonensis]|uniref:Hsp20/alpha crystallin family protein n=1 Tax=Natronomonas gomsonensis TaxID=1046043 RepID=UPI0020CA2769|nr:Hsp20/alpha crystallin family protein [Natronomonas gomsonensis]
MRVTPFDEMDRLLGGMRRSMMGEGGYDFGRDINVRLDTDSEGYVLHADLPGFEKEEIDLRYDDERLTIRAVHEMSDDYETSSRRVHETVRIPGDLTVDGIEARYHNGVLEVHLPTESDTESEGGHRIDID